MPLYLDADLYKSLKDNGIAISPFVNALLRKVVPAYMNAIEITVKEINIVPK